MAEWTLEQIKNEVEKYEQSRKIRTKILNMICQGGGHVLPPSRSGAVLSAFRRAGLLIEDNELAPGVREIWMKYKKLEPFTEVELIETAFELLTDIQAREFESFLTMHTPMNQRVRDALLRLKLIERGSGRYDFYATELVRHLWFKSNKQRLIQTEIYSRPRIFRQDPIREVSPFAGLEYTDMLEYQVLRESQKDHVFALLRDGEINKAKQYLRGSKRELSRRN